LIFLLCNGLHTFRFRELKPAEDGVRPHEVHWMQCVLNLNLNLSLSLSLSLSLNHGWFTDVYGLDKGFG